MVQGSLLIKAVGVSLSLDNYSSKHVKRSGRVETHAQICNRTAKGVRQMSISTNRSNWRGSRIPVLT